jgi:hypothetical protein
MSYVLRVEDLLAKMVNIARKPKTGKLIVGPQGQLSPKALNLKHSLGIKATGMYTRSQVKKVFRTK